MRVAILIALNDFIFEAQELQNLGEHARRDGSFLVEALRHLSSRLLGENFNGFSTFSELIELTEDLGCFAFKLLLQLFHCLHGVELLPDHNSVLVAEQGVDFIEQAFGRSTAVFEIGVDTRLREVAQYQNIVLLQLLGNNSRQN